MGGKDGRILSNLVLRYLVMCEIWVVGVAVISHEMEWDASESIGKRCSFMTCSMTGE